jgi:hypothetical protein
MTKTNVKKRNGLKGSREGWGHSRMINHCKSPFGRFLPIAHLAIPWAPHANVNLTPYLFSMGAKFMSFKKKHFNELHCVL